MANNFKWTVSIIAQVDDFSIWEYNNLRKTIEWQDKVENIRYVIFDYRQKQRRAFFWELTKDYQTLQLINNPELPLIKLVSKKISQDGEVKLTDPEILTEFFKYVNDGSIHHMVITWGHGSGLGYFYYKQNVDTKTQNNLLNGIKEDTDLFKQYEKGLNRRNANLNHAIANLSPTRKFVDELNRSYIIRFFKKTPSDYFPNPDNQKKIEQRTQELLTAEELTTILKDSFGKEKIDIYIANNCWTNMFEVGYALRSQVQLYAASQSILPFAGINYGKLFHVLEENPDIKDEDLALNITDNFLTRYTEGSFAKAFKDFRSDLNPRHFTISVNNLKYYGNLFEVINDLSDHLIEKLQPSSNEREEYLKRIDIARNFCGDFAQGVGYIDFTNFLSELIKGFQGKDPGELKNIYKEFFFIKDQTVLSILNPGELFRLMPNDFYSQAPQMFSIFFPSKFKKSHVIDELLNLYFEDIIPNTENDTSIWKGWKWPAFLQAYWSKDLVKM